MLDQNGEDVYPTMHAASITGIWDPGSVPSLSYDDIFDASQKATDRLRQNLDIGTGHVEFHIIAEDYPGGPVYRTLWRLQTVLNGPTLMPETTTPHSSAVILNLAEYPHTSVRQVIVDPAMLDMPYRGILNASAAALLLRGHFGNQDRSVTIDGYGTGTFTPQRLRYSLGNQSSTVDVPYSTDTASLASYEFIGSVGSQPPGMWLVVFDDGQVAHEWQISYCVYQSGADVAERWDEPRPAPAFVPLQWPADPPPWCMG